MNIRKSPMKYIKNIRDITLNDVALVGGKTASLGEMMHALSSKKFKVPQGFAITSQRILAFCAGQ